MGGDQEGAFKVYVVRKGKTTTVVSCHDDSLGFALLTMREEGQIDDDCTVGIRYMPDEGTAMWLIDPFSGDPFSD